MKNQHTPEPILPEATKRLLQETNTQEQTELICALAAEGWPVRVLSDATGLSKATIHRRISGNKNQTPSSKHPVPPFNHKLYGHGVRAKKIVRNLTQADRAKIHDLQQQAKTKTRWSTPTSKENLASEELDRLVLKYVQRKVSLTVIAKHMGVTRRAVAQRIEKFDV